MYKSCYLQKIKKRLQLTIMVIDIEIEPPSLFSVENEHNGPVVNIELEGGGGRRLGLLRVVSLIYVNDHSWICDRVVKAMSLGSKDLNSVPRESCQLLLIT